MKSLYSLLFVLIVGSIHANNMLVQNVTTLGNDAVNKTIQVQFDISWDNSWRDAINYDAAWIFMKFKNASGVWQHVQLNPTGFVNGTGTTNTVQVTNDKVGCWLYRTGLGSGTFNSTGMQLQWNYGLAGLTNVTGLEVRVFAVEMVYVPEGEFNCVRGDNTAGANPRAFEVLNTANNSGVYGVFHAPGVNFPVINNRLSPILTYNDMNPSTNVSLRIKGDAGLDTDNNGVVDNTTYPIGYRSFYCYKYEMTEQQYADFLNTLTSTQITTLGLAGTGITLNNGQYFSSTPNKACVKASATRLLAFADWAGIRPISFTEFNKASYGPLQPAFGGSTLYPAWGSNYNPDNLGPIKDVGSYGSSTSNRVQSGASYYGLLDMTANAHEPVVKLSFYTFSSQNGNGALNASGNHDIATWSASSMLVFIDQFDGGNWNANFLGFRFCRSAE